MKAEKFLSNALFVLGIVLLPGCASQIVNLTPKQIPENPSSIYSFSCATKVRRPMFDRESVRAVIVVNGERYPMQKSVIGDNMFDFDYRLPPHLNNVRYYYVLTYRVKGETDKEVEVYSDLFRSDLINRYVIQLDSDRAPVGARVGLVGRGFSEHDAIIMGSREVPTEFASPNSIHFYVPSLPSGRTYDVSLRTRDGDIPVGKFRVDKANLTVLPTSLSLPTGERKIVIFTIQFEAPPGGLYVDVTTDVPSSVIMPVVEILPNSRSVSIPIEGGEPGTGSIFVQVPGFNAVEIPVSVY